MTPLHPQPSESSPQHLRWPAERFYWADLDGSVLPASLRGRWGRRRQGLGYLFESVLPGVSIEDLHMVYCRLSESPKRYLACGLPRTVLKQEVALQAVTLMPASPPAFIDNEVRLNSLNLLTGSFRPKAVRLLQRRWLVHGAVILMACVGLMIFGLERRVHGMQDQINGVAATKWRIVEQLLGPVPSRSGAPLQPWALRLTAELRRLEQTRSPDVGGTEMVDCSAILSDVLACWPDDVHAQTESFSVTPTSITIHAGVATMADAQRLADAFVTVPGWRLHQPQSEARRDHVDVTLRFEPNQQEATP